MKSKTKCIRFLEFGGSEKLTPSTLLNKDMSLTDGDSSKH